MRLSLILFLLPWSSTLQISLNMMYNAQQPPSPKKHRRDGSDESFMFGSTKSSIGSNEYDQNTAGQQQHFDNRRPESTTCTASEKTDCVSEAARSSGVFARDFVPISLLPYFKVITSVTIEINVYATIPD